MKHRIKTKAVVLLGSNPVLSGESIKSKIDALCDNFIDDAIEEVLLSVNWSFALKKADIEPSSTFQKSIISDCLKVALMIPSKTEWYIENQTLFTKSQIPITCFYYHQQALNELIWNSEYQVPNMFVMLTSLCLSYNIAYSLYADSTFADSMRNQYLRKQKEIKELHSLNYEIVNSIRYP